MRAELPWNVAGIPPEAREAARAAARREGLSVGEWLTRRILRSFSGLEDELPVSGGFESRAPSGASLDAWGLPPSAAARRDTEEMMARVGRSENESNEAWRRIEDQMRGLSRRLDSSERSHSESNRALSRTTQEINVSAREQAQAFDQLGVNVIALNERLERLERSAANDGVKDAVKALHQGLSRLADQITATANNSASQVTQITTNLEQLAGRVGQARTDADENHRVLEEKLAATANTLDERMANTTAATTTAVEQRLSNITATLEQRIAATEKSTQFNTTALDHALEKLEHSANQRAEDQVEAQQRVAQTGESITRLEDAIARLEMRLPDAQFETRLQGIERSVIGIADRLEAHDPTEKFDSSMQALSYRLEALEREYAALADQIAQERSHRERPVEPPPVQHAAAAPFHEPHDFADEPPPVDQAFAEPFAPAHDEFAPSHDAFAPAHDEFAPAHDAFAPPHTPAGFTFDIPPQVDPFAVEQPGMEFSELFAEPEPEVPAEPENFLTQARRNVRAATEKAETERRGPLGGFFNREAGSQEKPRPRYIIPLVIALIAVLAVAASLVLMNRNAKRVEAEAPPSKPEVQTIPMNPAPLPQPSGDAAPFVPAPQAGSKPAAPPQVHVNEKQPAQPAPTLEQKPVRIAPINPVPEAKPATAAAKPAAGDHVAQLAAAGNPTALTFLGLKALDGQPANLPEAVKDLTQAAQKGQAVAQYRLGTMYERGQGVPADATQAAHWYELAAAQGNRKAMHNLAVSYASAAPGKKNMAEAARWFAKAAALGLSDSQFNLAVLYERGDGVPQSLLDAYKWYTIAAAQGDGESKSRITTLQGQLSDSDKAAAGKSAATFHAAPLNRSANVPPEAADLGG